MKWWSIIDISVWWWYGPPPKQQIDWWLFCEISLAEILDSNKCDQMWKGGGNLSGFIAQVPRLPKYGKNQSKFWTRCEKMVVVCKNMEEISKILDQMWRGKSVWWVLAAQAPRPGRSTTWLDDDDNDNNDHIVLIMLNTNEMIQMMMMIVMMMMMMVIPRSKAKALTTTMVGGHIIHFSRPVLNINLSLYSIVNFVVVEIFSFGQTQKNRSIFGVWNHTFS